jgi:hypothetical protein
MATQSRTIIVSVNPVVDSTTIANCTTANASKTVTSSAAFGSVVAGQRVVGVGIPFNTKVASKSDSSTILLDTAATADGTVSLQFGYFTSAAYATGDTMGFPFVLSDVFYATPKSILLETVVLVDAAKQAPSCELVLFYSTFTETADNAAFAPTDADAAKILAVVPISTWYSYSVNSVAVESGLGLSIPRHTSSGSTRNLYGQLVSRGSPTFVAVSDLTLNLYFIEE